MLQVNLPACFPHCPFNAESSEAVTSNFSVFGLTRLGIRVYRLKSRRFLKTVIFSCSILILLSQKSDQSAKEMPLSAFPKDTTSRLAGLSPHCRFNAIVKQGSCEYQLQSHQSDQTSNQIRVNVSRGGRFHHSAV